MKKHLLTFSEIFIVFSFTILFVIMIGSCSYEKSQGNEVLNKNYEYIPLSWEKNHPERKVWSNYLIKELSGPMFNTFDIAHDVKRFCPKYDVLNFNQKINMWAEVWSSISLYESSWNPRSASQDVGTSDKNTWSIGLTQISVVDQNNLKINLGYSYEDLLNPEPNLHLALRIMERQIQKTGLVILPNSNPNRYWAVILENNRYNKIYEITNRTKKLAFCQ